MGRAEPTKRQITPNRHAALPADAGSHTGSHVSASKRPTRGPGLRRTQPSELCLGYRRIIGIRAALGPDNGERRT